MKMKSILVATLLLVGTPFLSNASQGTKIEISELKHGAIKVSVKVLFGTSPLEGATVSIIEKGQSVSQATSDSKGIAGLSITDYHNSPVNIEVKMDGYQTHILSGVYLKNGRQYDIALVKGSGTITTEVTSNVSEIEAKGAEKVTKIEEKTEKIQSDVEKTAAQAESAQERDRGASVREPSSFLPRQGKAPTD